MKVYNIAKTIELTEYDLERGRLEEDTRITHIPYSPRVEEISHEVILAEYPNGGKEIERVIDIEGKDEVLEHDEIEDILVYRPFTEEEIIEHEKNKIREQREYECFPVINRGALWYDTLTEEQKSELRVWYNAWLNAPETGVIPEKPAWI